jgi:hypothetical protein
LSRYQGNILATTQLFVELLIIGIGAAIWLAFLLAAILHLPWGNPLPNLSNVHLTALLSVAYVVGIVVDRFARSAFQFVDGRQRDHVFGHDQEPSIEDRETFVLVTSSPLREQIVYNRSRLRICRSWVLNFALIAIFSGILAIQQSAWTIAAIALSGLALSCLTAYVARALVRDYYANIRHSYDFLTKNKNRDAAG